MTYITECPDCALPVTRHENWPATKIYINVHNSQGHRCHPRDIIIRSGKWIGYTRGEAADITLSVQNTTERLMTDLKNMFHPIDCTCETCIP